MRYIVDTHFLIWSLLDTERLSTRYLPFFNDRSAQKLVSGITFWEISLKYSLGKLKLEGITPGELLEGSLEAGYMMVEPSAEVLASSYRLPKIQDHKDPFDRLLIWQAIREDLVLITSDRWADQYVPYGLKLA